MGIHLKAYILYIDDERYMVPTMEVVNALSDAAVRQLARARLESGTHYLAVEIFEFNRKVGRVARKAQDPFPA